MNGLQYPRGAARAIADARTNGMRPAETVIIVLAGQFEWNSPMVYATPGQRYRWDWLQGLQAVVLIDAKTRLDGILSDIDRAEPDQLDVIDHERELGWLVLATSPTLSTVRWPRPWVKDWLSDEQPWHVGLNECKERLVMKAAAAEAAKLNFDFVEPTGFGPWN